jgi:hypothetical protein
VSLPNILWRNGAAMAFRCGDGASPMLGQGVTNVTQGVMNVTSEGHECDRQGVMNVTPNYVKNHHKKTNSLEPWKVAWPRLPVPNGNYNDNGNGRLEANGPGDSS